MLNFAHVETRNREIAMGREALMYKVGVVAMYGTQGSSLETLDLACSSILVVHQPVIL